ADRVRQPGQAEQGLVWPLERGRVDDEGVAELQGLEHGRVTERRSSRPPQVRAQVRDEERLDQAAHVLQGLALDVELDLLVLYGGPVDQGVGVAADAGVDL